MAVTKADDKINKSVQEILNLSFDTEFNLQVVEIVGYESGVGTHRIASDGDGHLQVDVLSGGGAGTQYTEGDTDATITGTALMLEGAGDALVAAPGTAAAGMLVNLGTNNDVTLATLPDTAAGDLAAMVVDLAAIEVLLGTIDADTGAIKTAVELLDNAVDGNYLNVNANIAGTDFVGGAGAVAAGVQRVTLASDDPAVVDLAAIEVLLGTMDTDTGNIATYTQGAETALEKIDGAIVGPGEPTIDSYTHAAINLNAGADQVLVSSAASKQIWVYGITYTCSVAGTVSFQDEDDTAITGIMDHAANSGLNTPPSGNFAMPIWKLATDKDLKVDVVTAAIDGWIDYAIVSV